MRILFKWCCIAISLYATGIVGQPLYRSVDEQGEVTFSDNPPSNAVEIQKVQVSPGPSETQQQESIERARRIESQASELGAANAARAQQRKDALMQSQQQRKATEVRPVKDSDNGYRYPNRPLYPPVISPPIQPELPILPGGPEQPVQLPVVPAMAPEG